MEEVIDRLGNGVFSAEPVSAVSESPALISIPPSVIPSFSSSEPHPLTSSPMIQPFSNDGNASESLDVQNKEIVKMTEAFDIPNSTASIPSSLNIGDPVAIHIQEDSIVKLNGNDVGKVVLDSHTQATSESVEAAACDYESSCTRALLSPNSDTICSDTTKKYDQEIKMEIDDTNHDQSKGHHKTSFEAEETPEILRPGQLQSNESIDSFNSQNNHRRQKRTTKKTKRTPTLTMEESVKLDAIVAKMELQLVLTTPKHQCVFRGTPRHSPDAFLISKELGDAVITSYGHDEEFQEIPHTQPGWWFMLHPSNTANNPQQQQNGNLISSHQRNTRRGQKNRNHRDDDGDDDYVEQHTSDKQEMIDDNHEINKKNDHSENNDDNYHNNHNNHDENSKLVRISKTDLQQFMHVRFGKEPHQPSRSSQSSRSNANNNDSNKNNNPSENGNENENDDHSNNNNNNNEDHSSDDHPRDSFHSQATTNFLSRRRAPRGAPLLGSISCSFVYREVALPDTLNVPAPLPYPLKTKSKNSDRKYSSTSDIDKSTQTTQTTQNKPSSFETTNGIETSAEKIQSSATSVKELQQEPNRSSSVDIDQDELMAESIHEYGAYYESDIEVPTVVGAKMNPKSKEVKLNSKQVSNRRLIRDHDKQHPPFIIYEYPNTPYKLKLNPPLSSIRKKMLTIEGEKLSEKPVRTVFHVDRSIPNSNDDNFVVVFNNDYVEAILLWVPLYKLPKQFVDVAERVANEMVDFHQNKRLIRFGDNIETHYINSLAPASYRLSQNVEDWDDEQYSEEAVYPEQMTIKELKRALKSRGLPIEGTIVELRSRIREALGLPANDLDHILPGPRKSTKDENVNGEGSETESEDELNEDEHELDCDDDSLDDDINNEENEPEEQNVVGRTRGRSRKGQKGKRRNAHLSEKKKRKRSEISPDIHEDHQNNRIEDSFKMNVDQSDLPRESLMAQNHKNNAESDLDIDPADVLFLQNLKDAVRPKKKAKLSKDEYDEFDDHMSTDQDDIHAPFENGNVNRLISSESIKQEQPIDLPRRASRINARNAISAAVGVKVPKKKRVPISSPKVVQPKEEPIIAPPVDHDPHIQLAQAQLQAQQAQLQQLQLQQYLQYQAALQQQWQKYQQEVAQHYQALQQLQLHQLQQQQASLTSAQTPSTSLVAPTENKEERLSTDSTSTENSSGTAATSSAPIDTSSSADTVPESQEKEEVKPKEAPAAEMEQQQSGQTVAEPAAFNSPSITPSSNPHETPILSITPAQQRYLDEIAAAQLSYQLQQQMAQTAIQQQLQAGTSLGYPRGIVPQNAPLLATLGAGNLGMYPAYYMNPLLPMRQGMMTANVPVFAPSAVSTGGVANPVDQKQNNVLEGLLHLATAGEQSKNE